jgi:hypothetical protein
MSNVNLTHAKNIQFLVQNDSHTNGYDQNLKKKFSIYGLRNALVY